MRMYIIAVVVLRRDGQFHAISARGRIARADALFQPRFNLATARREWRDRIPIALNLVGSERKGICVYCVN